MSILNASADLHVHTTASDGTASPTQVLAWAAEHTDLKVIAICDHNTNEGAIEAAAHSSRFGVEVVVGQEVESANGHILGLWTPQLIAPGMPADKTVAEIHHQGGLAIAAHPFAPKWWKTFGLCRGDAYIYDHVDFDGVEVANSTPLLFLANHRARHYWHANSWRLTATGGSDAHMPSAIGTSRTLFPGSTVADLRTALEARTTRAWGPSFDPSRALVYAAKIREIQQRDHASRESAAARGIAGGCGACEGCSSAGAAE